ncbi:MAG: response regulator, partial [Heteroscytonema crispum UTEX LB 1556]
DVKLPDTGGWKVLDLLRNDLNYRHIPIHLISGEENRTLALKRGARSFLMKPLTNQVLDDLFEDIIVLGRKVKRNILVVEDNEIESSQIAKILKEDNISISVANTGKKALKLLSARDYDCIILDYTLPDIPGDELVSQIASAKNKLTPIIVYSAKDFNKNEWIQLSHHSNA